MSRRTFGQEICGAFLGAGEACVPLGSYVDAVDELIDAAVESGRGSRLRRAVQLLILERQALAVATSTRHPGTAIPGLGWVGGVGSGPVSSAPAACKCEEGEDPS